MTRPGGRARRSLQVALVGCTNPPQEDFDAPPLLSALALRGHQGASAAWDDPAVGWSGFDVALLRSTWNYFHRRDAFLAWAERVANVIPLFNPPDIVRWNTHKFYLRELAARGIDIAPTLFVPAGSQLEIAGAMEAEGWEEVVVKPAVSADSFATVRATRAEPAAAQVHLDAHLRDRDMLVQRYLPAVVEPGERCLVFLDGRYSHAVRKRSLFMGGRHAGPEGVPVEAAADEIAAGERILAACSTPAPLYARIDFLRGAAGEPCLMELELVEPSLFFDARAGSAVELVAALEARLAHA
jgi:glutathione synthase/RimK-type ligase-like ATP-grasp enzyme